MNPTEPDDSIDHLLREDSQRYLDDNGFTTRVIRQLPRRRLLSFRSVILFVAALIGAAITCFSVPPAAVGELLTKFATMAIPWKQYASWVGPLVIAALACSWAFWYSERTAK